MNQYQKAFSEIAILVKRFESQYQYFTDNKYSEAEVRKDFIDKFFTALGWDVDHNFQHNPYFQEVKVEKAQKQSHAIAQKRADYAFFLKPDYKNPKFFVEAKKPARNLKNADDYFQTIRYGWNAGTGVSILTDFEEFHIVDCRFKPNIDFVFSGHHKVFNYQDYLIKEKFDEIYWLVSYEAVSVGNIEKYVGSLPKPRVGAKEKQLFGERYQTIDESFLEYIDGIREKLAKAFKRNDESLDSEILTEAVQRTVDRLVFIRFLEDKLIEPENFVDKFGSRSSAWRDFINTCHKLDVKYNGIVFKRHQIDKQDFSDEADKMFAEVCRNFSHLKSPYAFNFIPVYILGSIYERFLGKVVIATDKRVRIEEKPEVRKAGGVYYTPKYVVDYIVKNTVGKIIENKNPKEIAKLKFADIACGSGSFLIGVLECLLEYHIKYYNDNHNEAKNAKCAKIDGAFGLTIRQKQQILVNCIFGVDLDHQAVEVTQLSLYLKMLEDETTATANEMNVLFHEKILPDLSSNIKCGNSIIESDILHEKLFEFKDEKDINPFDYKHAFPLIFRNGGFDAIVGNPPYIQLAMFDWFDANQKKYLLSRFCSSMGRMNTFGFFIEKGIKLLNEKGMLGFIVPNTILTQEYYEALRKYILDHTHIDDIVSYEHLPFADAVVETATIILTKGKGKSPTKISYCTKDLKYSVRNIDQKTFEVSYKKQFNVTYDEDDSKIRQAILKVAKKTFDDAADINQAIALKADRAAYLFDTPKGKNFKPVLDGRDIGRYNINWSGKYLKYDINAIHSCKREDIFLSDEKIFFRRVSSSLMGTIDKAQFYALNTLVVMNRKEGVGCGIKYILGLFNSKLLNYYYSKFLKSTKKVFSEIQARQIGQLPFKEIDFKNEIEKRKHDEIEKLVEEITELKSHTPSAKTEKESEYISRKIETYESRINELVYELYELPSDAIENVEKFGVVDSEEETE